MELVLQTLKRALDENRKANIIYETDGVFSERTIRVYKIENGNVLAYCYLRKKKRTFKLQNILSAQIQ